MKLFSKDNDEQIQLDIFSDQESEQKEKPKAPHVLTKDEVLSVNGSDIQKTSKSALDALKERVKVAAEEATQTIKEQAVEPKIIPAVPEKPKETVLITEEIKVVKPEPIEDKEKVEEPKQEVEKKPSLYEKCKPFLLNEDGSELLSVPLYQLKSVAEILNEDSKEVLDRLSEHYEFNYDPKIGNKSANAKNNEAPIKPNAPTVNKYAPPITTQEKAQDKTVEINRSQVNKVKNPQSNVAFVISDIDASETTKPQLKETNDFSTATITFTPVSDGGNEKTISVSQNTRSIDLTGEILKIPEEQPAEIQETVKLESNDFDEYVPKEEMRDAKTNAKILRKLAIEKRNRFLSFSSSILFLLILLFFKLPFMDGFFIENPTAAMTVCTVITGLIAICNADMLLSLKNVFSPNGKPDIIISFATIVTFVYSVVAIDTSERFYGVLLSLSMVLCFRACFKFFKISSLLMGAKTVAGPGEKIALRLIDEQAITFAMAKTAIDGDVLLAAPQKTDAVDDFMKYSTYGKFLNGKMPIIVAASLIFAALLGIASYSYFESVENGLYAAAASLLICASPVLFFIDDLPFYRASKKLFARRSCLAGKMGAQTIENANAVVLNAADIFPSGTVTLHDIKVLNDNDMEDTLIRASVLAESANSPLAPIFKKITKSSNVEKYPDSDTVKYEDRMGISGWVDNRLLFIGNRTLMEAHGIEVPSLEVDKKLLREGYFPVYIATRDKVCALLSVQYAVDSYVQKELWRLTKTGVTVLVNSTDPNLTNQMICDYLELYEDSVFVMATVGTHVYKNTVVKTSSISAPAVFRGSGIHLVSILNAVERFKKSNILLTVMYVLTAVLGITLFVYYSFSVSGKLLGAATLFIYLFASAIISYLIYLIKRP